MRSWDGGPRSEVGADGVCEEERMTDAGEELRWGQVNPSAQIEGDRTVYSALALNGQRGKPLVPEGEWQCPHLPRP